MQQLKDKGINAGYLTLDKIIMFNRQGTELLKTSPDIIEKNLNGINLASLAVNFHFLQNNGKIVPTINNLKMLMLDSGIINEFNNEQQFTLASA